MSRGALLCGAVCFLAGTVQAQEVPADVSREQVAGYRAGIEMGCRSAGRKRGDPRAEIDHFCACMMSTLRRSLTPDEWQLAAFYSLKKRAGEERLVLDPHLSELRACRPAT